MSVARSTVCITPTLAVELLVARFSAVERILFRAWNVRLLCDEMDFLLLVRKIVGEIQRFCSGLRLEHHLSH